MIIFFSLLIILFNFIKNENITILNESESIYYDFLFNSIDSDYYNMSLIYNFSYTFKQIIMIFEKLIIINILE